MVYRKQLPPIDLVSSVIGWARKGEEERGRMGIFLRKNARKWSRKRKSPPPDFRYSLAKPKFYGHDLALSCFKKHYQFNWLAIWKYSIPEEWTN
jgi:hypothetical protein